MQHDGLHARFIRMRRGERHMREVEQQLAALDERIGELKRQKFFKTKLAFVTFSEETSYIKCLKGSPRGWISRMFMKPEDQFRGKFTYTVSPAPAPTDVMFENLDVSETSRFWRRRIINIVTVSLLIISFSAITVLATAKRDLTMSTNMDQQVLALAIGGPGGGIFGTNTSRQLASTVSSGVVLPGDFIGTEAFAPACRAELAACEVTYSEPGLLTLMPWGSLMTLMPVNGAMSATEREVKVKAVLKEIEACGNSETGCSKARADAVKRRACHACYCAGLQFHAKKVSTASSSSSSSEGGRSVDSFTDKERSTTRDQCDPFLEKPGFMAGLDSTKNLKQKSTAELRTTNLSLPPQGNHLYFSVG